MMKSISKNIIIKSTLILAMTVILSKILGFLRDAIIAAYFGVSFQTDAFFFASSMPGIPAVSMSLSTVFLPLYVQKRANEGKNSSDEFCSKLISVSMIVAFVISSIAILFSPVIVRILAPGFDQSTRILAIKYSRIVTATLALVMAHYMLMAILNANKIFGRPQLSGVLLNVVYIAVIFLGSKRFGADCLLVATISGAIAQVAYLCYISRKVFRYKPIIRFDADVKSVLRLTLPVLLGNAVIQIHESIDQMIGSILPVGTISILIYGLTLSNIVKTIIINALSSVYYPHISEAVATKSNDTIEIVKKTYSMLIIMLLPISVITIICSRDIVSIVYEHGNFSGETASLTSQVLLFYAIGFVFSGIREISSKTLYAINKMSIVTKNGAIAVLINIALSYVLSKLIGVGGIALATAFAEIITMTLLVRSVQYNFNSGIFSFMYCESSKYLISIIVLVGVSLLIKYLFRGAIPVVRLAVITLISGLSYFSILAAFGVIHK